MFSRVMTYSTFLSEAYVACPRMRHQISISKVRSEISNLPTNAGLTRVDAAYRVGVPRLELFDQRAPSYIAAATVDRDGKRHHLVGLLKPNIVRKIGRHPNQMHRRLRRKSRGENVLKNQRHWQRGDLKFISTSGWGGMEEIGRQGLGGRERANYVCYMRMVQQPKCSQQY